MAKEISDRRARDKVSPISDADIGEIVQFIAYKQCHEDQADDFVEKVWILKNILKRR